MMNALLKHRTISRQLITEVIAGKYSKTGRLPSEAQLVKRFGVSRPTVGRAMRELQEQGLIERRAGSGTYIRTEKDRRHSAHPIIPQIGLLIPSLCHTEIFEPICGELASLSRSNDYGLWWGANMSSTAETNMTAAEAEALCGQFIERGVMGVFFVPFEHQTDRESTNQRITERLKQAGIPVVLLDRDIGVFPNRSEFDIVGIDNVAGGYLLADHLIKLGVRRMVYVKRPLTAPTVDSRIIGAQKAMLDNDLQIPQPFVYCGDPANLKFVNSFAQNQKIDAILCTSDHLAAELLQTLTRIGIRVPKDLRLVGFDNVRFACLLSTPLTTVEQPIRDIAITAFSALRERMTNPTLPARTLILTPRLVVRESCGAYLHQPQPVATETTRKPN
jgi:DNA-binding LacI/PurR family transcriptional regulator